jgi:hypothetical protein
MINTAEMWLDIFAAVPDVPRVRLGVDGLEPIEHKEAPPPPRRPMPRKTWRVRGVPDGRDRPRAGYWRRKH